MNGRAAEHRAVADRLAACKIRAFRDLQRTTSPTVSGVYRSRKAAANPWPFGRMASYAFLCRKRTLFV